MMESAFGSFQYGFELANSAFGFIYGFIVGATPYIVGLATGHMIGNWIVRRFSRGRDEA